MEQILIKPAEEGVYEAPLVPGCADWATAIIAAKMSPELVLVTIITFRALTAS